MKQYTDIDIRIFGKLKLLYYQYATFVPMLNVSPSI